MNKVDFNNCTLLDLFSGIGGFHKGLSDAGFNFKKVYFSEIDKYAIANYRYNYEEAEHIGSVVDINGVTLGKVNITTFGFPCQDVSIAGLRGGLKARRSGLFYQAARLLRETQSDMFIWENVYGLLSSNDGKDIEMVCEELYLSGYVFDFQDVNTSWILPQNRQRIYSIGYNIKYLQQWIISNQDGQNQKLITYSKIIRGWVQAKYHKHLTALLKQSGVRQKELGLEYCFQKEQNQFRGKNLKRKFLEIINTLQLESYWKCYQKGLRLLLKECDANLNTQMIKKLHILQEDIKYCVTKELMEEASQYMNIEEILNYLSDESLLRLNKFIILTLTDSTTTLKTFSYAEMGLNIELFIIHLSLLYPNCWQEELVALIEQQRNMSYAKDRRKKDANTREGNNAAIQLSLFGSKSDDLVGHLTERFGNWEGVFPIGEGDSICNKSGKTEKDVHENTLTLTAKGIMNNTGSFIMQRGHGFVNDSVNNIRRLTEIECEILQGFPDSWTKYGNYDGVIKEISKTQRYKMIGNAVTAKMVELIGSRIIKNFK